MSLAEVPYCAVTHHIEVQIAPMYLPDESCPESGLHVFFYAMRLINRASGAVAIQSRHYVIRDGYGTERSLEDAGMRTDPVWIAAGDSQTFQSYCPLPTACGSVRGYLRVEFEDGTEARVEVPVLFLRHQDQLSGQEGLYRSIG